MIKLHNVSNIHANSHKPTFLCKLDQIERQSKHVHGVCAFSIFKYFIIVAIR